MMLAPPRQLRRWHDARWSHLTAGLVLYANGSVSHLRAAGFNVAGSSRWRGDHVGNGPISGIFGVTFRGTGGVWLARLSGTLLVLYVATYWLFSPSDSESLLLPIREFMGQIVGLGPAEAMRFTLFLILVTCYVIYFVSQNRAERGKSRAIEQQELSLARAQLQARAQATLRLDRSGGPCAPPAETPQHTGATNGASLYLLTSLFLPVEVYKNAAMFPISRN